MPTPQRPNPWSEEWIQVHPVASAVVISAVVALGILFIRYAVEPTPPAALYLFALSGPVAGATGYLRRRNREWW